MHIRMRLHCSRIWQGSVGQPARQSSTGGTGFDIHNGILMVLVMSLIVIMLLYKKNE